LVVTIAQRGGGRRRLPSTSFEEEKFRKKLALRGGGRDDQVSAICEDGGTDKQLETITR